MDTTFDSKQFRGALSAFATGITVVTSRSADGKDFGLTATSFNSVSLDPPMVLWSLDCKSSNAAAFEQVDAFAVHILAAGQEHICKQFSTRGIDRFAGLDLTRGHGDVPVIQGCTAVFECRIAHRYQGGDHVIMVGEVLSFSTAPSDPLVFYRGKISGPFCTAEPEPELLRA
ncbi:flavin reductase family protein [Imbroritus primus]|uniref:flavin reductase family protein n=1 Tax=Imbroritus primus TaxID=3058603 RepID=UPI003D16105A